MTIIERAVVTRSITFACAFCVPCTIEMVVLDHLDGKALDHLPEGWTIIKTAQFMREPEEQLICPKHQIKVERPVEKKKKGAA